jgi:hypothetical protein
VSRSNPVAKTAGLSKRGKHNQSIDPSRLTSDADEQSDRNPYSAIAMPSLGAAYAGSVDGGVEAIGLVTW